MYDKVLNAGGELGGDPNIDQISVLAMILVAVVAFAILGWRESQRRRKRDQ